MPFRDEIAACTEKAYPCISLPEAARILYFESDKDMRAFGEKVKWYSYLYLFKSFLIKSHVSCRTKVDCLNTCVEDNLS